MHGVTIRRTNAFGTHFADPTTTQIRCTPLWCVQRRNEFKIQGAVSRSPEKAQKHRRIAGCQGLVRQTLSRSAAKTTEHKKGRDRLVPTPWLWFRTSCFSCQILFFQCCRVGSLPTFLFVHWRTSSSVGIKRRGGTPYPLFAAITPRSKASTVRGEGQFVGKAIGTRSWELDKTRFLPRNMWAKTEHVQGLLKSNSYPKRHPPPLLRLRILCASAVDPLSAFSPPPR